MKASTVGLLCGAAVLVFILVFRPHPFVRRVPQPLNCPKVSVNGRVVSRVTCHEGADGPTDCHCSAQGEYGKAASP